MPILDLYFLLRRRESDAVFGSFFVRWLAAVLTALVRMVASGKCDFNPGVTDSDQLSDLGCTSFFSVVAAAVLDAAEGDVVSSDAAALSYDVAVVLFDGSCAVAVILSDAAPPFLMGLVLWCYLLFSPSLPSSA